MAKINFAGHSFSYDEKAFQKYTVVKGLTSFQSDPEGFFKALGAVFKGKDEEYAALLDDDIEMISELLNAIMEKLAASNQQAKN